MKHTLACYADCMTYMYRDHALTGEEFTSALATNNKVKQIQGMCVECVTDCDCSVNEFCGYDFDDSYDKGSKEWTYTYKVTIPANITSANDGGGMPAAVKKEVELYAKQVEGLPIRSKCKKYSTSHIKGVKTQGSPSVCDSNMDVSAFGKMVEQSLLTSPDDMLSTCDFKDKGRRTATERTPKTWPKDAQGVYFTMPCIAPSSCMILPVCNESVLCCGGCGLATSSLLCNLLILTGVFLCCAQIDSADASYLLAPPFMRPGILVKQRK